MWKHKSLYLALGTMGALVILLGTVGAAYAQGHQPPEDSLPSSGSCPLYGRGPAGHAARLGGGPAWGRAGSSLVDAATQATGLAEGEVIAALQDGKAFAEIAEAEGMDTQEIVHAFVAEHRATLQEAVDEGRLTEEQMEQMLEGMTEHVAEHLDETWAPRPFGGRCFGRGIFGWAGEGSWTTAFDAVAEALGLTPEEFFTELHDGKTVAEVAEEQGIQMEAIRDATDAARTEIRERAIGQAVEEGRMSQEQADWMLEGLEKSFYPGGRNFGPGRGFGRKPGFGRGPGRGW